MNYLKALKRWANELMSRIFNKLITAFEQLLNKKRNSLIGEIATIYLLSRSFYYAILSLSYVFTHLISDTA